MKTLRSMLSVALLPVLFAGTWALPTLASAPGDAGPESPKAFASPARPDRAEVADALELRVAGTSQLEPGARFAGLVAAADAAAGQLAGQRAGQLLAERALRARWEGLVDRAAAAAELREDLTRWVSDLRFRPIMEAELPPGFPELPTPIHEIEVRSYPGYRMAQASMGGRGDQGAFWKLFQHIQTHEVAMTAPVETTYGEAGLGSGPEQMAFLYEGPTQGSTGMDGSVEVLDVPAAQVLSIGVRGNDNRSAIAAAEEALRSWLETHQEWQVAGPFRIFGYNSPGVRGLRRCFEVQVPVKLGGLL